MENEHSTELSSELSVFEEEFIEDAIVSKNLEPKHPVTSIGDNVNAPIDFNIDGTEQAIRPSECFIKINCSLIGTKIVTTPANAAGGNATVVNHDVLSNDVRCSIINNIGHSLFSKVSAKLGNREVSSLAHYPYISYLNTRLNFSKATLDSYGRVFGWYPDVTGDNATLNSTDSLNNVSLAARRGWFARTAGNSLDLIIHPFSPLFMLNKIILPFIPLSVRLERVSNHQFYLQYPTPGGGETVDYRIKINSAIFYTQYLELTPEYSIGLEQMLTRNIKPVTYKMPEPQLLTFNVAPNIPSFNIHNMFNGSVPDKILVMFVTAAAFNGDHLQNPYNFINADVRSIGLYRNGIPFPHPPIEVNFGTKDYALAFHSTLTALMAPSPVGPSLPLDEFVSGTTIFAFDTSPDSSATQMSNLLNRTTNMRLEVTFGTAPTVALVCLVYFERELRVSVDGQRNVSVSTLY